MMKQKKSRGGKFLAENWRVRFHPLMPANATPPRSNQKRRALALAAAAQAARVLKHFEAQRTKDVRPRHAIAAARAWARGKIKCGAARAAKHPSAIAAARAAGHAAATAHMAGHAQIASAYATKSARIAKMEAKKTNLPLLGNFFNAAARRDSPPRFFCRRSFFGVGRWRGARGGQFLVIQNPLHNRRRHLLPILVAENLFALGRV